MSRESVDQRAFARLWVAIPYFDAMVDRCGQDSGTIEVGVQNADPVMMAGLELFCLDHNETRVIGKPQRGVRVVVEQLIPWYDGIKLIPF